MNKDEIIEKKTRKIDNQNRIILTQEAVKVLGRGLVFITTYKDRVVITTRKD